MPAPTDSQRRTFAIALAAYLAFVIYGSLVPLDFQAVPWDEALDRFSHIPFLDLGIGSRADWVANLLLFIPLAFLAMATLDPPRGAARWVTGLVVWLACACLALGIEFTQIYFPPRTVSQNDILAESLGAVLGIGAWVQWGHRLAFWLARWRRARGPAGLAEQLLWLYLFLMFGYNLLPLDLTFSPVELYHKWNEGRIVLIPFGYAQGGIAETLFAYATDMILWFPVSLLVVLSGHATPRRALIGTLLAALTLELLQLMVYSRVSDVTDLITALPGAWLGAWLGARLTGRATPTFASGRPWLPWVLALVWSGLLLAIFWYPYDFHAEGQWLRDRLGLLFQVPFENYYFGTEFRAITEFFHKVGLLVPLGALLAWGRWGLARGARRPGLDALILALALAPTALIEAGQLALPDKHPDSTDWLLEWLGVAIGYLGTLTLARRWHPPLAAPASAGARAGPAGVRPPQGMEPSQPPASPGDGRPQRPSPTRHIRPEPAATPRPLEPSPWPLAAAFWALLPLAVRALPAPADLPPVVEALSRAGVISLAWAWVTVLALLALARARPAWIGALDAWLAGRALPLGGLILGLAVVLPLRPEAPLTAAWHGEFSAAGERLYLLLKAFILWVPLGAVAVAADTGPQMRRWMRAGIWTFWPVLLPLLPDLRVLDLFEILAAAPGLALGLALGRPLRHRSRRSVPRGARGDTPPGPIASAQAPATAASPLAEPVPPSAPVSAAGACARQGPRRAQGAVAVAEEPPAAGLSSQAPPTQARTLFHPGRAFALPLALLALVLAWDLPGVGPVVSLGLVLYAAALVRWPQAWLAALPMALPLLDLAPWTGRFYLDAFDLVVLMTLAGGLWHPFTPRPYLPRGLVRAALAFALSWLLAMVIGLWPLPALDANAFSSYLSHYNALRVGKGLIWAYTLAVLLYLHPPGDPQRERRLFLWGTALGLAGVGLAAAWERWLFVGLWDFEHPYRVLATFSTMHTGGAHLDGYLVLALPLVLTWLVLPAHPWERLVTLIALTLGSYALVATVSRGTLAAFGVAVSVFLAGLWWWRGHPSRRFRRGPALGLAAALLGIAAIIALGTGGYFKARWAQTSKDTRTRLHHWAQTLEIMDPGPLTTLFGMGLGRFPATWLFRADDPRPPGTYAIAAGHGNPYLVLGSGETLYVTQRIALRPQQDYRIRLRARAQGGDAPLDTTLCERHLSHSRRCVWPQAQVPDDGAWHTIEIRVNSGRVGSGHGLARPPVDFALFNPTPGRTLWIDDVELLAPDGRDLLHNGDFSAGMDRWFIKTHEHLAWHIKNLGVALWFSQGLLGVLAFLWLVAAAIRALAGRAAHGGRLSLGVFAASLGFLTLGLVSSLFDAPRLTLCFLLAPAVALWLEQRKRSAGLA